MFDLNALEMLEEDLQQIMERAERCRAESAVVVSQSKELVKKCRLISSGFDHVSILHDNGLARS